MTFGTLAGLIRAHGRGRAGHPAIEFEGHHVTYGELDERSSQVAVRLSRGGLGPGDRVAFLAKNCPEFYEVLFGAAKIGAVTVAVNWRLSPGEITAILRDSGSRIMLLGAEFAGLAPEIQKDAPLLTEVLVISGRAFADWRADCPALDPGYIARPDEVALQFYTSGTTGSPKGVLISQRNFFTHLRELAESWCIGSESRVLCAMPGFHIGGTGWSLACLRMGSTLVLLPEVDQAEILARLPGCTNAFLVPAVIAGLVTMPELADVDLSSLHTVVYAASPISPAVLRSALKVFGCDFIQTYGLTESSGAVIALPPEAHDPDGRPEMLSSCGRPYPWVELRLIEPDSVEPDSTDTAAARDVPTGTVGEVWIRSTQVVAGYWNRPEETAAAITADGWLRTGDAGYLDDDGYLFLQDRIKDMIVSGAENVYPVEVEHVLIEHPTVADVAVIGVPDDRWGETVKAVVVPIPGAAASAAELIGFCRSRLAHFKCPTTVDFVESLPRNPSGKLLKRVLREPYWSAHSRRVG